MVGRNDFHVEVLGKLPNVEQVVGTQAHVGPGAFGEPLCFGFESSSHVSTCRPRRVRCC